MKENLELSYQQEHTFHPEICPKSQKIVTSKSSHNLQNLEKPHEPVVPPKPQQKPITAKRNSELLQRKFKKSFEAQMFAHQILDKLSQAQILASLLSMGILQENPNKKDANNRLIAELWRILEGDSYEGVHKANFYQFLLIVLRLPLSMNLSNAKNSQKIGNFDENGLWTINSSEELKAIQRRFEIFYLNKLSTDNCPRKSDLPVNLKARPSISPISKILALHHREKLLNEVLYLMRNEDKVAGLEFKMSEDKILNNIDLLVLQRKIQKLHHQYLQEENLKKEDNLCTFNPKLKKTSTKTANKPRIYSLTYNRNKKDKDPFEVEFEKNKKDCTFKPEIASKSSKSFKRRNIEVKNETKAIERMRNARFEKEFLEACRQRGAHSSHAQSSYAQSSHAQSSHAQSSKNKASPYTSATNDYECEKATEEKTPLLFVDVNLGANVNERIVICEGDRSEDLARKFCGIHSKFSFF